MAKIVVDGEYLIVRLSPLEKLGALRGDIRVPRSSITRWRVSNTPWKELRGLRAPGTGLPGVISLCTRRGRGIRDFAAVYGKQPAVVVELEGTGFNRLVISAKSVELAEETARALSG